LTASAAKHAHNISKIPKKNQGAVNFQSLTPNSLSTIDILV